MSKPSPPRARDFSQRHMAIGPTDEAKMLAEVGYADLDALIDAAGPAICSSSVLQLPPPVTEAEAATGLAQLEAQNISSPPMIGPGYPTHTPAVIRRNIRECPSWHTANTPRQREISQGRVEAVIKFQTTVGDLTGLPTANASGLRKGPRSSGPSCSCSEPRRRLLNECSSIATRSHKHSMLSPHAQSQSGSMSRSLMSRHLCWTVTSSASPTPTLPALTSGASYAEPLWKRAWTALVTMATGLHGLTVLRRPEESGAEVAVRSQQRFGVPPIYGRPHAAFTCESDVLPTGFDPDKHWPPVACIEEAYGDRNSACTCPDPTTFEN